MRKQIIGVLFLMFGLDYVRMLRAYEGGVAAFGAGQWVLAVVSAVMIILGLYLSIVGWREFNKVLDEREKEKKEAENKFKLEAFSEDRKSSGKNKKDE